jgi:RND superfamily putative drug exporter
MSHLLYRIGQFAARRPWRVLAVWLLLAVAAVTLNNSVGGESNEEFSLPGSDAQAAADAIEDRFPQQTLFTSNVVFHSEEGLTDPAVRSAVSEAASRLGEGPHVVGVNDPFDPRGPTVSEDGTTAIVTVGYDTDAIGTDEFEAASSATTAAREAGVQVEYDGGLGYAKGDAEPSSEIIGIGAAVLVLLVAFGSLVAMSLPIVVALSGILIGTSAIGILSGQMAVPQIATIVGVMLGLGVGIDYALFVLARHRQHLDAGMPVPEAVGRANATAGLSVMFAGVTVVVAIAGMQLAGIPMLAVMGWASALMVAITMLAAVTLLPALLGVVGRRVNSLRVPFIRPRPASDPRSASSRWAATVVAHPLRYGIVAAVLLALLAVPVSSMRLGFADAGNDGPSTTTRKAYDLIAEAYGPGTNGTLQVVVDSKSSTASPEQAAAAVSAVSDALAADPGVASVGQPVSNEQRDLAVLDVTPTTGPQQQATSELLQRLRDEVLPAAVEGSGTDAMVTGGPAIQDEVAQQLADRMLWFLGAVIGLSFLILMLVFRSVLLPLKAAVLNLLSVGASYGVVVAVFQWGWGASLIGVEETVPIMPLAPMLMFAILFGLSMDYEVFLVSRMREQYLRHHDPKRAIVEGVGATARVITSAALIMMAVFGAFILASDVTTKLFGVGFALAVLLDVTLVRMVLVPAVMSLLGHRAWWLPGRLDRALPTIAVDTSPAEDESQPEEEPATVPDRVPAPV